MAKHQWKQGESGNPKGAPPKARRLTRALEQAINRTLPLGDKKVSGRRLLADMLRDLAIYGKTKLPDGEMMSIDPKQQVDIAKFIYAQVDGAPVQTVNMDIDGRTDIVLTWADAQGDSAAAPSGAGDSQG